VDVDLVARARQVMIEAGFTPEPPAEAMAEAARALPATGGAADRRDLLFSSIDNPESRDLDQLEWAERLGPGRARLLLAIADVDALCPASSAMDQHAAGNTTSVYTGIRTFPMLPDRLSGDLTSLHEGQDRLAVLVDMVVRDDGQVEDAQVSRALVRNQARLVYGEVGRWLEGAGPPPAKVASNPALAEQLQLQAEMARWLKAGRRKRGALELETAEARPISDGRRITALEVVTRNRARDLIEDFMLAGNSALAAICERENVAWIRRIVRSPARWERLVALAAELGGSLPVLPSGPALAAFLDQRRQAAPDRFGELSLAVVKLIGSGEYAVERAGEELEGHFGLAVDDYTHGSAPNRRYADLVTQRIVKAVLTGRPAPYGDEALAAIAQRCTQKESDSRGVERKLRKLGAAALLADRTGERFAAVITGVTRHGTFARLDHPPAEGKVVSGDQGLDVGDRVEVQLLRADPDSGHIDLAAARR
jgi:VacB/RNase II family 3'-5' exoribonuclease